MRGPAGRVNDGAITQMYAAVLLTITLPSRGPTPTKFPYLMHNVLLNVTCAKDKMRPILAKHIAPVRPKYTTPKNASIAQKYRIPAHPDEEVDGLTTP